jgi:thiol-disulfide isomerase/thioredoxin/YHS domain-containing protein
VGALALVAQLALVGVVSALQQVRSTGSAAGELPAAVAGAEATVEAAAVRSVGDWNLGEGGLALAGFDPVACFPEGGGKARKGSPEMTLEQGGAIYRFASEANRDRFRKEPARYEPAYGGWCAWAMAQEAGEKVEVDPESFLVQDGRLLLFYDGFFADTRASWRKGDGAALARAADGNWERLSGESPRRGGAHDAASSAAAAAPDFALQDPSGTVHRLADLRGRVVVLDFWATWCPPCREAMPGVQALHERYADRPVTIFGVNVAERSPDVDPAGFMREQGCTYTMLRGTDAVARAYGVRSLPTFVVIGPDGTLRETHVGGGKGVAEVLGPLIEAALPAGDGAAR